MKLNAQNQHNINDSIPGLLFIFMNFFTEKIYLKIIP